MEDDEFNEFVREIREGFIEPAIENATKDRAVPTMALLTAQFQAALSTCFALTEGDAERATGWYRDAAEAALDAFLENADLERYRKKKKDDQGV